MIKIQIILDYDHFYSEPIHNRLDLIKDISKTHLLAELAGINYKLKPTTSINNDTSLQTQINILEQICCVNELLFHKIIRIIKKYTYDAQNYPLIFIRNACLFGIEEITQSDIADDPNYQMAKPENNAWERLLKYILLVNKEITNIQENNEEPINFETLNPKLMVLNEYSLETDPITLIGRGKALFDYFNEDEKISLHFNQYIKSIYGLEYDEFLYDIMGMYFNNFTDNGDFNMFYKVQNNSKSLFDILSCIYKNDEISGKNG